MPRKKPTEKQVADLQSISQKIYWLLWHSHRLGYGETAGYVGETLDEIAQAMGMPADYQDHMNADRLFQWDDDILNLDPSDPAYAEDVAKWERENDRQGR